MTNSAESIPTYLRIALDVALATADPHAATIDAWPGLPSEVADEVATVVAFGKAAPVMALAARSILGAVPTLVVSNHDPGLPTDIEVWVSAHPIPDGRSVTAGERVLEIVQSVAPADHIVFLVSGGGSALIEVPIDGVTIAEIQSLTDALLRSGAPIESINTVRTQLSAIKGGRLAAAANAPHTTLALSDVIGSAPHLIASGPTSPPMTTIADAMAVLDRFNIDLPPSVRDALARVKPLAGVGVGTFTVIADGEIAAAAAVESLVAQGCVGVLHPTPIEGEASVVAAELHAATSPGTIRVAWGETTVTVKGSGSGGRNQEGALALAETLDGTDDVAVMFGTDGIDGPTDAAGAIVDGTTVARGETAGMSAHAALANNDAYGFFDAAGGLIRTGPTGTNVGDIWIVDRSKS